MLLRNRRQTWPSSKPPGNSGAGHLRSDHSSKLQKVAINYDKLQTFCAYFTKNESPDHQFAMREYPSIFLPMDQARKKLSRPRHRPHTCCVFRRISEGTALHNIKTFTATIHGETVEKDILSFQTCLKAILAVIEKIPIVRSNCEVQQLADCLKFFSYLFPVQDSTITMDEFFVGLARRATLEELPRDGYELSGKGGLYMILQGCVERQTRNEKTKHVTSTLLWPGKTFGEITSSSEEAGQPVWTMYPHFSTTAPSSLLYINVTDYNRVVQNCEKMYHEKRRMLVKTCPLLHGVSPIITSRLTDDITWETIPANTTIVHEGDPIERVMFIKEGQCTATAKVTGSSKNVHIHVGDLGPLDCIGEVLLRNGIETHPYSIITSTCTLIGIVSSSTIKLSEVKRHISSDRTLSLPILTEQEIRNKYSRKVMNQQWCKVKDHILEEVVTERGIQFGTKKWKHTTIS